MLIRIALALVVATTTACYAPSDPEPSLGEPNGTVICEPFCEPYNGDVDDTLRGADSFARSLFADAFRRSESCVDLEPGIECLVVFSTSGSPCGPVTVDCVNSGSRLRCDWFAGGCD